MLPLLNRGFLAWLIASLLFGCGFEGEEWSITESAAGSLSSPVATDLNRDGTLDIIIGGAAREFERVAAGVLALDGTTGEVLWRVPAHNQVVGTAIFRDITGDGTEDVFIGGRSAIFKAIDGRSGRVLWEFMPYDPALDYLNDTTLLNFYTGCWVADIDADGVADILTAYGGFVRAPRGETDRPAGYLMILSGRNGRVLRKVRMPDGKETYLSPDVHDFGAGPQVLYGTGGEDIDGNLYRISLDSLIGGSLAGSQLLVGGRGKGMIAPPVLADLTGDGVAEVVVATVDGRLVASEGRSGKVYWTAAPEGDFDTYVMPAVGYFTGDDRVPDFFVSLGKGAWPDTEYTLHMLIDGQDGCIVSSDTLGSFQYANPVVADFDRDGKDDVLVCINTLTEIGNAIHRQAYRSNELYLFPRGRGPARRLVDWTVGTNIGSTPLLTDLDGDGLLDLITATMGDPLEFYSFRDLNVRRRELDVLSSSIRGRD